MAIRMKIEGVVEHGTNTVPVIVKVESQDDYDSSRTRYFCYYNDVLIAQPVIPHRQSTITNNLAYVMDKARHALLAGGLVDKVAKDAEQEQRNRDYESGKADNNMGLPNVVD